MYEVGRIAPAKKIVIHAQKKKKKVFFYGKIYFATVIKDPNQLTSR